MYDNVIFISIQTNYKKIHLHHFFISVPINIYYEVHIMATKFFIYLMGFF